MEGRLDAGPFGPLPLSCLDFIIQYNKSVVHNDQRKHSDLNASIVDIQLNVNQLNFRFYIEMIQKCKESVAASQVAAASPSA